MVDIYEPFEIAAVARLTAKMPTLLHRSAVPDIGVAKVQAWPAGLVCSNGSRVIKADMLNNNAHVQYKMTFTTVLMVTSAGREDTAKLKLFDLIAEMRSAFLGWWPVLPAGAKTMHPVTPIDENIITIAKGIAGAEFEWYFNWQIFEGIVQ